MANNFLGKLFFSSSSNIENDIPAHLNKFFIVGDLNIFFKGYISNISNLPFFREKKLSQSEELAFLFAEAYRKWGVNLIRFVFGEFSLAIIDTKTDELFLTHDALAICPLFYCENSDGIVFSSSLQQLFEYKKNGFGIDEIYIADFLAYGDHFGDRTPYKDIKRLAIGESLLFKNCNVLHRGKFTLSEPDNIRYSRIEEYEEHFKELLSKAINSAIPKNLNTWCELSGGLDSSTVACTAATNQGIGDIKTFSFVYSKSKSADESKWIESVNNKLRIQSVLLDVDSFPPFSKIPSNKSAQPYLAMINYALFEEYANLLEKNNVDVVLTGEGGDAVLFGDGPEPFFFADFLRKGNFVDLIKHIRYWTKEGSKRRPARYWLEKCTIQPFINWKRKNLIQEPPSKISWLTDINPLIKERNGIKRVSWVPSGYSIGDSWYLERIFRCSNVVSFWDHRSSMRSEFRHPLMNMELICFMRSIPWDVKLSPFLDRFLQRNALREILPENIVRRKTKGSPDPAIYAGLESSNIWNQLLTKNPRIVANGYVQESKWYHAVELARLGQCESIKQFKAAAALELWLRQF